MRGGFQAWLYVAILISRAGLASAIATFCHASQLCSCLADLEAKINSCMFDILHRS